MTAAVWVASRRGQGPGHPGDAEIGNNGARAERLAVFTRRQGSSVAICKPVRTRSAPSAQACAHLPEKEAPR